MHDSSALQCEPDERKPCLPQINSSLPRVGFTRKHSRQHHPKEMQVFSSSNNSTTQTENNYKHCCCCCCCKNSTHLNDKHTLNSRKISVTSNRSTSSSNRERKISKDWPGRSEKYDGFYNGDSRHQQLERMRDGLIILLIQISLLCLLLIFTKYEEQADASDSRNSYIPVMGGFDQEAMRLKKHYISMYFYVIFLIYFSLSTGYYILYINRHKE